MTYRVFFIDDVGEATDMSGPLESRDEAEEWEKRYWSDYFRRNPGSTVYFCSTEIRESR